MEESGNVYDSKFRMVHNNILDFVISYMGRHYKITIISFIRVRKKR